MNETDKLVNLLAAKALIATGLQTAINGAQMMLNGDCEKAESLMEVAQRLKSLATQYAELAGVVLEEI